MLSRILIRFFLSVFLFVSFLQFFHFQTSAQDLNNVSIVLFRNASSTTTTLQACVTTPSTNNGTENNVKITFPTSFTVSTTTSNWTVGTANIPSDATAWPGISTATNVSGKTVTFPSSDLNTNTKYCFRTTNSNSLTTSSSNGSYEGSIATYATSSLIDSKTFALNVGEDQVTVTATVPANPTDFEAEMNLTSPSGTTFPQDTTLTYTLTYGSTLTTPTDITVEAEWSLGTISGSGTPSVEILDYVIGSASNAYNSTSPVVDLINRKITWTIDNFPTNTTGETVTFKLKTNDNYTGAAKVSFDVSGRVLGPGTQSLDSTVTKNYQYSVVATPTPTNAPQTGPTNTPAPNPTATPTPTIQPGNLQLIDVEIRQVGHDNATIFASFNQNSDIILSYGTSPSSLSQSLNINKVSAAIFELENLSSDTPYYFQIKASNPNGSTLSDIFTFTTSKSITKVALRPETFVVVSQNIFIYDARHAEEEKIDSFVIVPKGKDFTFNISLTNPDEIRTIQAFLRNKYVLANNDTDSINVSLIELHPGEYTAALNSGLTKGFYELYIRISDISGNVFEKKTAEFKIDEPLKVLEEKTLSPIEGARVKLSVYNPTLKIFEEINPRTIPIENPSVIDINGISNIVLPQGRYKAEVSAFLFEGKTVEFVLGKAENESYPTVLLKRQSPNPFSQLNYFLTTAKDYYNSASNYTEEASKSNRIFDFAAFLVLSIFTLLVLFSLLARTQHNFKSFIHSISYILKHHSLKSNLPQRGKILDLNDKPISKASVNFLRSGEVIFQTMTNSAGLFFTNGKEFSEISVERVGFIPASFPFNHQIDESIPTFHLKNHDGYVKSSLHIILDIPRFIFGLLFEVLLVILIIVELLFIPAFGIIKVLPYLIITIGIIIFFVYHKSLRTK